MAFSSTITNTVPGTGSLARVYGTYTNTGGGTGGDIKTYLNPVVDFSIKPKGAAVLATQSVINETFPLSNSDGSVTIVTSADETGYWEAWGFN